MKKLFLLPVLLCAPLMAQAAFDDVPADHPYAEAILYLQAEGLVEGYEDNTYRPEQTISRAEFTKILLLAEHGEADILACTETKFGDISAEAWYVPFVCFAQENGIIQGYPDNTFGPQQDIIYAEAAKIIVNTLLGVMEPGSGEPWYEPYTAELEQAEAVPAAVAEPTHALTRGEMAEIIFRLEGDRMADQTPTPEATASATDDDETVDEEEPAAKEAEDGETLLFDGQSGSADEPAAGQAAYTSEANQVRFFYSDTSSEGAPTTVFEDESEVIVGSSELTVADYDDCVDLGYCSEVEGTRYEHLDSFYVLTKPADKSFEQSILDKIAAAGRMPEQCQVIEVSDAPQGWTKAVVEPVSFESFVIDDEGIAYDEENVELSDFERKQLREAESVEKCTNYAGGFGYSFFLFSEDKSERRYLFVPSYGGVERLIDFESVEF